MILNTLLSRDLLIDAYKFYSRGDARAHDAINIIIDRNDMSAAVLGCIEQAIKEDEPDKQNLHMQAASFGKKFHPGIAIEEYTRASRLIRVKNICSAEKINPELSINEIVEELIYRTQFQLALWIVSWMRVEGEEKVRAKWSEFMIEQITLTDEEVSANIKEILGCCPIVPYADVANKAIEHNRIPLAIKLIENENQSFRQIPLLLQLRQYDSMLTRALSTHDSNLIYMSILKLRETMLSELHFLDLLKKHEHALKYYCNFLAATDIQTLIMISSKNSTEDELIFCLLDNRLDTALAVTRKTQKNNLSQQIETCQKLRKFQNNLERLGEPPKSKQRDWTSLSVCDTIIKLIIMGKHGRAKDCQRDFGVSDKKYKILELIAQDKLPKLAIPTNPS